ncbi:hypothetical protein QJQ45_003675 [Haematococcus lacustris]|nr:hypothetical protein QJQ45_003675 [Haematococcus lacustris]
MKWVSRQHYHQERGVAVFLGAGNFSQGGWKAGAVRAGFRKVMEQPSMPSADPRSDRLVIVDEFRTSRVSSSVHARQPCELHLPDDRPRPADWVPPAGQVNHRLLRPAWSLRHAKCVRGLKWCHEVPPNPPPPPPAPLAQASPASAQALLAQEPPAQDSPPPAQDPPPPPPAQDPPPPPPAQDQPPAQPPPGPVPRPQAPPWGRWLDRDTNPCLYFQRIGESKQRPLELCSWTDLMALPLVGKEYQQGYKLVNDRLPKAAKLAGLGDDLTSKLSTVFVPSDEALAAYAVSNPSIVTALSTSDGAAAVTAHVVPNSALTAADIPEGESTYNTVAGTSLLVSKTAGLGNALPVPWWLAHQPIVLVAGIVARGGKVVVTSGMASANVIQSDISTGNAIIHIIDNDGLRGLRIYNSTSGSFTSIGRLIAPRWSGSTCSELLLLLLLPLPPPPPPSSPLLLLGLLLLLQVAQVVRLLLAGYTAGLRSPTPFTAWVAALKTHAAQELAGSPTAPGQAPPPPAPHNRTGRGGEGSPWYDLSAAAAAQHAAATLLLDACDRAVA